MCGPETIRQQIVTLSFYASLTAACAATPAVAGNLGENIGGAAAIITGAVAGAGQSPLWCLGGVQNNVAWPLATVLEKRNDGQR